MDFIHRFGEPKIQIANEIISLPASRNPAELYAVRLLEDIIIPPEETVYVHGYTEYPAIYGDCIFEVKPKLCKDKRVEIPESIGCVTKNTYFVPVNNKSRMPTKLYKKSRLGHITSLSVASEKLTPFQPVEANLTAPNYCAALQEMTENLSGILPQLNLEHLAAMPEQQVKLEQLILRHINAFAQSDYDLGRTDAVLFDINTGDHPPIKQHAYRVPVSQRPIIMEMLAKMEKQGVIRPSVSPWASPVVIVTKKTGDLHMCIDL